MKKSLLLAASACLFAVSANSQIRFGPELGLNINKFDYEFDREDIELDESTNMGVRVGIAMDICIAKNLTVQPGLYYSAKGGERDFTWTTFYVSPFNEQVFVGNTEIEESVDVGYIEIPLILNYHFGGSSGFFIGLGPTVGFAVNADRNLRIDPPDNVIGINGNAFDFEEDVDLGSEPGQIDGTDIGLMLNIGYEFDMGLFIRPFMNWGLSDLSNRDGVAIHNRTFGIGVGWWFGDK